MEAFFLARLTEIFQQMEAVFFGQNHKHTGDATVPIEFLFKMGQLDVQFFRLA